MQAKATRSNYLISRGSYVWESRTRRSMVSIPTMPSKFLRQQQPKKSTLKIPYLQRDISPPQAGIQISHGISNCPLALLLTVSISSRFNNGLLRVGELVLSPPGTRDWRRRQHPPTTRIRAAYYDIARTMELYK